MHKLNVVKIRRLMIKCGLTWHDIARQAGLSVNTICRVFKGKDKINTVTLYKLARFFCVDERELIETE